MSRRRAGFVLLLCLGLAAIAWLLSDGAATKAPGRATRDAAAPDADPQGLLGSAAPEAPRAAGSDAAVAGDEAGVEDPDDEDDIRVSFRMDVVDATTGRLVDATWNLGPGHVVAGPFPPGAVIDEAALDASRAGVEASIAKWSAAFLPSGATRPELFQPAEVLDDYRFTVLPLHGYVLEDPEVRLDARLAAGVTRSAYVLPTWQEAVLDLRVLGPDGRPVTDVSVYRLLAAGALRPILVEHAGPGELQLRRLPHMPGEPVRAVLDWGWTDAEEEVELEEVEEDELLSNAHVVTTVPEDPLRPWRVEVRLTEARGPATMSLEVDNDLEWQEEFSFTDGAIPEESATARVRVLGCDGRPVEGATVDGQDTEASGELVLTHLFAGEQSFEARAPGRIPARGSVVLTAGGTSEVTLREPVGARLDVLVTDPEGRPRPSARVEIRDRVVFDVVDGVQRLDPFTDAAGRRTFARVEPGEKTEVVATWGSRTGTVTVDLVDGETARVTIVAQ